MYKLRNLGNSIQLIYKGYIHSKVREDIYTFLTQSSANYFEIEIDSISAL